MGTLDTAAVKSRLRSSMDDIVSEKSLLSTKSSIFLTPKQLLKNNEKSYVPYAFSIGPLHHDKIDSTYAYTEEIKLQYTRDLIQRVSERNRNRNHQNLKDFDQILKDLVEEIASIDEEARRCYAAPVTFPRDKFVEILLVDGCFLIELFHKEYDDSLVSEDDPLMRRAYLQEVVVHDLFLLENQIPWLVLEHLYRRITFPDQSSYLTYLAECYFCKYSLIQRVVQHDALGGQGQRKHILELLNSLIVEKQGGQGDTKWELIPSASSLVEAGVKFKVSGQSNGMLNIKFSNGVLEIPPLTVQEVTEPVFRNLISFEQCYLSCPPKFTSYVILLDSLINTPNDVDILSKSGIIKNWLNPQEVAQIFKNLYSDTYVREFYYSKLCQEVNKYCKSGWPKWRAMYIRNHFSSPWAIVSQVFAALIFILSLLQTVFTIKK